MCKLLQVAMDFASAQKHSVLRRKGDIEPCLRSVGSGFARFGPVSSPRFLRGIRVVTLLPLSHNYMYHVISPSPCLERKTSVGVG
jgi:hypothetical protein